MMTRVSRTSLIAGALVLACLAVPGVAAAADGIDELQDHLGPAACPDAAADGPSSFQAGGAIPDAGSCSMFAYPNASEDLKTALTNFAPGLLGNPESVPKCPQADLEAGGLTCPAGSQIGTSRLDVEVAGTTPRIAAASLPGTVYNAEPLGNEPGPPRRRHADTAFGHARVLDPVRDHAARRRRLRPDRHADRHQPR